MSPDETVAAVLDAFQQAFPRQTVQAESDFFDLGGDSLNAESLAMLLSQIAGHEVQLSSIFDHPTPNEMASYLGAPSQEKGLSASGRPPIFMVHGDSGYTVPKKAFYEGLAEGQRLELLQLPGLNGDRAIPLTVRDMAAQYVDRIAREYPDGPVRIGAFCNGSLIAIEMAHLFRERGRPVEHVVLLDPHPPSLIDAAAHGETPGWDNRLGILLLTGRFTGGASRRDVEDMWLLRVRRRLFAAEFFVKHLRSRLTGHKADRLSRNIRAQAALTAAFHHSWPAPYDGSVQMICARQRAGVHDKVGAFWRQIVPNMELLAGVDRHEDVTGASGPEVARLMQASFDKAG